MFAKKYKQMKNKNFIIITILAFCTVSATLYGFISKKSPEKQGAGWQYMMVDVVETTTISDGMMLVHFPDGTTTEADLRNYYGGFIAKKPLTANGKTIIDELNKLAGEGWEITQISNSTSGFSLTRFYLKKSM
jgi:hypothetical protein